MKKQTKKVFSGIAGAAMMLSGCASVPATVEPEVSDVREEEKGTAAEALAEGVSISKIAHVTGEFSFSQNTYTPADQVFNIFGTALTGVCASPVFALENSEEASAHYINVGGHIREGYTVALEDLAGEGKESTEPMMCSCATGPAVAAAVVSGVKLTDIIELADLEPGVNTITAVGSDGYGKSLPLSYAVEKGAMLAYKVDGSTMPYGTQLWLPDTVAQYFTRDVVDLILTAEDEEPEVQTADEDYRTKVNILNYSDGVTFHQGETITFEGYADDCGQAIAAVEFSLDNGETWTSFDTTGATSDLWVCWSFAYTAEEAGDYCLSVRAVTEDGNVSPLTSSLYFTVAADEM